MFDRLTLELSKRCTPEEAIAEAIEQLAALGHTAEAVEGDAQRLLVNGKECVIHLQCANTQMVLAGIGVGELKHYSKTNGVLGWTLLFGASLIPMIFVAAILTFSAIPIPFQRGLYALYFLLYLTRCASCFPSWKEMRTRRKYKLAAAAIVAISVVAWIPQAIFLSYPELEDPEPNLADYCPFRAGDRLATLDEPAALAFTVEDDLPTLDGATALYPVYAAFTQAVYPQELDYRATGRHRNSPVECNKTGMAYQRLINGEVDMIFVAGPSQLQLEAAGRAGVELTFTPIGKEAFVFFVNQSNPVESLTLAQLQDIYAGDITNWSQVGGPLRTIRAYQRPQNSGSQTALQNMMGDRPIRKPVTYETVAGMGGIIRKVSGYRNQDGAIGFTFRYFATEMAKTSGIRLLQVNGVPPDVETIRDGSYPLTSEFYAVTAGSDNPNVPLLLDWICSAEGQTLVARTGYAPVGDILDALPESEDQDG